jgi:hypothetical protein
MIVKGILSMVSSSRGRVYSVAMLLAPLLMPLLLLATAPEAPEPLEPRARVEHHLREAEQLARHFEGVLAGSCPEFDTTEEWDSYVDSEVDRVVLLLAHLERARFEARASGDGELRQRAREPRKRAQEARRLVEKFMTCADDNGGAFDPLALWPRIERDVARRQAEIALPR